MKNNAGYIEIAKDIEKSIKKQDPGEKLNSEAYYQKKYNVARMTITRAFQYLVTQRVVYYVKNKGYFILNGSFARGSEILSFTELNKKYGVSVTNRVLDISLIDPSDIIKAKLNLSDNEKVYHIKRIRYTDGKPNTVEDAHIVEKIAKGLEKFNFEKYSLYQILKEYYGIVIDKMEYEFSASVPTKQEMEYLQCNKNQPVQITKTTAFCNMGTVPVEFTNQVSITGTSLTLTRELPK